MYLRPYKKEDAQTICSWCRDEETLMRWTANYYQGQKVDEELLNDLYIKRNGDCAPDNFYPFVACIDRRPVGSFIIRYLNDDPGILRIGFVIIDDTRRNEGLGKQLIDLALTYCFEIAKARKVTIGVFTDNLPAYNCYKACGFLEAKEAAGYNVTINVTDKHVAELEMDRERYEERKKICD